MISVIVAWVLLLKYVLRNGLERPFHGVYLMRDKISKEKTQSGFSLLELLVAICIFGVLAAIAVPGFMSWMPNYRLKGAARDVYSNLQLAKMGAIRSNADRTVTFTPGAGAYTTSDNTRVISIDLSDYGSSISFGQGKATQGVGGEAFGDNVTYTAPSNTASFNPRGMGNNEGYIYITNIKGTAYAIGSRLSGVIFLKKWNEETGQFE
jgi:prepilin-type N-terminal cleavage/methylation domain-containing protein